MRGIPEGSSERYRQQIAEQRSKRMGELLGAGCTVAVTPDGVVEVRSPYGGTILAEETLSATMLQAAAYELQQQRAERAPRREYRGGNGGGK